ncbi:hypothetical protein H6F67_05740 [Microcoleus sp. FACHB-1515]|uniref:hypothetical protein n=1 Tax=Cyanophyceae TaxID=3028117 RepID=UPI0016862063|nr:hypothetical protein [Microcoleus sp. FACHB-1515]MBD2089353.1 hypothetical protein [Microcoleus sp. FACHB-1515]
MSRSGSENTVICMVFSFCKSAIALKSIDREGYNEASAVRTAAFAHRLSIDFRQLAEF